MKPSSVQIFADRADNSGTFDKGILYFRVHDQIHVSLTVPGIRVCQAVELLRKNLEALGEQRHMRRMDGNLSGLCPEHFSLNADHIAYVQLFELFVVLLAHAVPRHIGLDVAFQILHIAERRLSHHTLGHHASCDGYLLSFQLVKADP